MPNPPRRSRFQIHLSTAIVMMFAAGALIWANVRTEKERYDALSIALFQPTSEYNGYELYGWPIKAIRYRKGRESVTGFIDERPVAIHTNYSRVLLDTLIALGILFPTWFVCEWLIRRRAAQKEL